MKAKKKVMKANLKAVNQQYQNAIIFLPDLDHLELIGWKMPLVKIQRLWQPLKGRLKVDQLNETYALSWFFFELVYHKKSNKIEGT